MVISGSSDNTVQVWNMETEKKLWEFDHGDEVKSIIIRDDWVITCCEDKSVLVLALETGVELHRLCDHPSECQNVDLSPNKAVLAVACNSAVVLWDMKRLVKIKEMELGPDIMDLRFNPSGDRLIVGLKEGEVFKIEMK